MTLPDDPGIPVRIAGVTAILRRTPRVLRAWLDGLPEPWLRNREGPDTWSPHDILGHLIHGEKTDWMPRLRQMLEGRGDVPFEPFDRFAMLAEPGERPTTELLDELEALRARNLADLEDLAPGPARFGDPGLHPDLGPVTVGQLLATWAAHDLTHIAQIARVMAKQYREEVGAWRAYLPLLDRPVGPATGAPATVPRPPGRSAPLSGPPETSDPPAPSGSSTRPAQRQARKEGDEA